MANPIFNEKAIQRFGFSGAREDAGTMTIQGTINKSGMLLLLTVMGAVIGWNLPSMLLAIPLMILNLVLVIMISRKPARAATLSQVYAVGEGVILGIISAAYNFVQPGLVSNALFLTLGSLLAMLGLYRTGLIKVNDKFRSIMFSALIAISLTYFVDIIMGLFGHNLPMIHQSGTSGIIFSVVVVGVAAFSLLMDFDMIERTYRMGAPKYMEWYGGFALLVTLVWLYIEILRLLSKMNKR